MRETWHKIANWLNNLWDAIAPEILRSKRLHWIIGPVVEVVGPTRVIGGCRQSHKLRRSDMSLVLTDSQKVKLKIQPKSKGGNPATVDGVVVWNSSDPTVVQVVADPADTTGQTAWATAVGLGTAQVQATADADLGPGVRNITAVLDIEVKAGEAVSVGVVADAPVEVEDAPTV